MNFLSNFLEKLRNKPEKERLKIVFVLSLIVTLILIFLFQKVPFFKSKKEKKREEIKVFEKINEETQKRDQKIPSFFEFFQKKEQGFEEKPKETSFFNDNPLKFEIPEDQAPQEQFYRE
jgi:hypothetical protein